MTAVNVVFSVPHAWITPVDDPSTSVHSYFRDRTAAIKQGGDVRFYAGGRARVITTANRSATYPLTLQLVSDADLVLLESWQGRVLLLRDGSGRRVFGTFLGLDVTDYWDATGTLHDVGFTFTRLSFSEGV